jgi:hypothetical protein
MKGVFMRGRTTALLSTLIVWMLFAACGGPVTEEDLQRWSNNDKGLERITELVSDPKEPVDTRIRALEVVVEKGFVQRLVAMLDGLQEDREEIMSGLIKRMKDRLLAASADADPERIELDAKDALLLLTRYVEPAKVDKIQEVIATWAFNGITDELTEEQVEDKIARRLSGGQIKNLGRHAYAGSAILIANKIEVDQMLELLSRADDKRKSYAAQLAVKGLKKLHKQLPVQVHHIVALGKLPSEEAAKYLLQVYRGQHDDEKITAYAFNGMDEMVCPRACGEREHKKDAESCAECCAKQNTTKSVYDRRDCQCQWDGKSTEYKACLTHENIKNTADNLGADLIGAMKAPANPRDVMGIAAWRLQLLGVESLAESFKTFKDSPDAYEEEFASWMGGFCDLVYRDNFSTKATPVFVEHLEDPNWAVRAMSIICLKSARSHGSASKLRMMAKKLMKKDYDLVHDGKYKEMVDKALKALKKNKKLKKEALLPVGTSDVSLVGIMPEDSFKAPMSIGKLALNAVVGLRLLKSYEADYAAKKLDKEGFDSRVLWLNSNTSALDDTTYRAFVEDGIARVKKAKEEAKKKADEQAKAAAEATAAALTPAGAKAADPKKPVNEGAKPPASKTGK